MCYRDLLRRQKGPHPPNPMFSLRSLFRTFKPRTLLPVGDLLLVNVTVLLALWLWTVRDPRKAFRLDFILSHAYWFLILSVLWLLVAVTQGLYRHETVLKTVDTLFALVRITILFVLLYIVAYFFGPTAALPRGIVLYTGAASLVAVGLWRLAYISGSTGSVLGLVPEPAEAGGLRQALLAAVREALGAGQPWPAINEEVFSTDEVAEMLKVHRVTVWRWCKSGKLPAVQVGQQWRIRARDLQAFIEARSNTESKAVS